MVTEKYDSRMMLPSHESTGHVSLLPLYMFSGPRVQFVFDEVLKRKR